MYLTSLIGRPQILLYTVIAALIALEGMPGLMSEHIYIMRCPIEIGEDKRRFILGEMRANILLPVCSSYY
jgi:hypothetical protein